MSGALAHAKFLNNKCRELGETIKELRSQNKAKDREIAKLLISAGERDQEILKLTKQVEDLEDENMQLREQVQCQPCSGDDQETIKQLQEQLFTRDQEIINLKSVQTDQQLQEKIKELETQIAILQVHNGRVPQARSVDPANQCECRVWASGNKGAVNSRLRIGGEVIKRDSRCSAKHKTTIEVDGQKRSVCKSHAKKIEAGTHGYGYFDSDLDKDYINQYDKDGNFTKKQWFDIDKDGNPFNAVKIAQQLQAENKKKKSPVKMAEDLDLEVLEALLLKKRKEAGLVQ